MTTRAQSSPKPAAGNGKSAQAVASRKLGVSREQLLKDTEYDPQGAEEFVALLHSLRRKRAAAGLGRP